jgi:hypothetical protein
VAAASGPGLGLAAAFLLLGLAGEAALAQQRQGTVVVQVMILHADPQAERDDSDCAGFRRELGPVDVGHLRIIEKRMLRLAFGENGAVVLPIGSEVRVMPISIHRRRLHMQLAMPGRMNTRLQMRRGKPVILGGPRMQRGHLLVRITSDFAPEE